MAGYSVKLTKLIKEYHLEKIRVPENLDDIVIESAELNRPGLQFAGFYKYFDPERIQIIGKSEFGYLSGLSEEQRLEMVALYFSKRPRVVITTWNLMPAKEIIDFGEKYSVPVLRTAEGTSEFMAALTVSLSVALAKRITRHGVLVEVYGEGILLFGESGVGKSEIALELIKRGHRLIADDAVEIRRVSPRAVVGAAPENIRHFMELRGVGIINARNLFGMGAVKTTEKIDMVIQLEQWDDTRAYDRMGATDIYTSILDVKLPLVTIPVKPGRNLAVIIEVAAMNNRQKRMGHNAAQELLNLLGMPPQEEELDESEWETFFTLDN